MGSSTGVVWALPESPQATTVDEQQVVREAGLIKPWLGVQPRFCTQAPAAETQIPNQIGRTFIAVVSQTQENPHTHTRENT